RGLRRPLAPSSSSSRRGLGALPGIYVTPLSWHRQRWFCSVLAVLMTPFTVGSKWTLHARAKRLAGDTTDKGLRSSTSRIRRKAHVSKRGTAVFASNNTVLDRKSVV